MKRAFSNWLWRVYVNIWRGLGMGVYEDHRYDPGRHRA